MPTNGRCDLSTQDLDSKDDELHWAGIIGVSRDALDQLGSPKNESAVEKMRNDVATRSGMTDCTGRCWKTKREPGQVGDGSQCLLCQGGG